MIPVRHIHKKDERERVLENFETCLSREECAPQFSERILCCSTLLWNTFLSAQNSFSLPRKKLTQIVFLTAVFRFPKKEITEILEILEVIPQKSLLVRKIR